MQEVGYYLSLNPSDPKQKQSPSNDLSFSWKRLILIPRVIAWDSQRVVSLRQANIPNQLPLLRYTILHLHFISVTTTDQLY